MSRYTGSTNKRARRVGFSILENGKDLARRPYRPGQNGQKRQRKPSDYSLQLLEKQKMRFMYGLSEKQFYKTYLKASKMSGVKGDNFFKLLEARLDNVVYRLGLARTRSGARQLVNHGHIIVDGKKVDIPSFSVKPGSTISVKEKDKELKVIKEALELVNNRVEFVTFDESKMAGTFVRYPERNELNPDINESMVVEFYSKR